MKMVIEKAGDFKKSIEAIAALIDEAEFTVNENGLFLKATDPSQIAMIDFEFPKNAFKELEMPKEIKLGIDMDYLRQIMNRAKSNDLLSIELKDSSNLSLTLKGNSTRSFSLPLIDVSAGQPPNPKIEFEAEIKMKASLLQEALKDCELVSGHIVLGASQKCFYACANSSKGTLRNETLEGKDQLLKLNVSKECKAMYPLDYLKSMLKMPSGEDEVILQLRNDAPVKVECSIGQGKIAYYLAPRIESE